MRILNEMTNVVRQNVYSAPSQMSETLTEHCDGLNIAIDKETRSLSIDIDYLDVGIGRLPVIASQMAGRLDEDG